MKQQKDILINENLGKEIEISGWIRFNRPSKKIGFIDLFDGSLLHGVQIVYKSDLGEAFETLSKAPLYSALTVKGILVEADNSLEIKVLEVLDIRLVEKELPIGKNEISLESLREIAHLRPRTKYFQAGMKIRSHLSQLIHSYFAQNDWLYVHAPILTGNDAEGAGESFKVSLQDGSEFYSNPVSLTVSGQLQAEGYAQAFQRVYTFGPTFRAENSNTTRHASEFWMIEPEATFCDYNQMMDIASELLTYLAKGILETSWKQLKFLSDFHDIDLKQRLETLSTTKPERMSYRDAIQHLKDAVADGTEFVDMNIEFGLDLGTEHEKFLTKEVVKGPVFVYDYPSKIKSFYMYQNGDDTARGFDLLVPEIGELMGGSQREDRYDVLMDVMKSKNINPAGLEWYTDLRRQGYAPSSGLGLGFERLVMYFTGIENIRDSIPFPRTTGKVNY